MKNIVLVLCLLCLVFGVNAQKLTEYLPESPTDTAVVVCPGGSYYWLAKKGEGSEVAQ